MRNKLSFYSLLFTALCVVLFDDGYSFQKQKAVGYFADGPVQGLTYKTLTQTGNTNAAGKFEYLTGETVTFTVGDFVLGAAPGDERMTPAHFITVMASSTFGTTKTPVPAGDPQKVTNRIITNLARFIQSLDKDGNIENGVTIDPAVQKIVSKYQGKIIFDQSENDFTTDSNVTALFKELNLTLRTPAQARNHLRRTLYGIRKATDVKIPTRDGSSLLANVFFPADLGEPQKHPVIMSTGSYGKMFGGRGCICNAQDALKAEESEDDYFASATPYSQEHFETLNTVDFVPQGYIMARVDERGICNTPGKFEQFSLQEAKDYYDAIEWFGKQPWSNGRVAINGSSYYGMNAFNVAQLQPPSLKAMLAIDGDIDSYRDYIYSGGGLYNTFNGNTCICCVEGKQYSFRDGSGKCSTVDWVKIAKENPFADPLIYGPQGSITISSDPSKILVPFLSHDGVQSSIHLRGTSEAFINAASKNKKFALLDEIGGMHGMGQFTKQYMDFLDYWLKGIDNGIMKQPAVQVQILTGHSGYYWLNENEWPIARTQYIKFYLDAAPSEWSDGQRSDLMKLSKTAPTKELFKSYSGETKSEDPCYASGVSFVTEPLAEDTVLAGYGKLVGYVSSTTKDMALYASVRAIDENNQEVSYRILPKATNFGHCQPFQRGSLKVSHRKLDPAKSTIYRPYHTHLAADYEPLRPGEIVEAQVELWPGTAMIKKGWRIRLDLQPAVGCSWNDPAIIDVDSSYQAGSSNTIYSGPKHASYLQLPIIPSRDR
jgi:uncharacterized protein